MKKVFLIALATAGVVGSFGFGAPSASAAVAQCSAGVEVAPDVTLVSCISVDPATVQAQGRLSFGPDAAAANVRLSVAIPQSGGSVARLCPVSYTPGVSPQSFVCSAQEVNPAGQQAWQAVSGAFGATVKSPTVLDS